MLLVLTACDGSPDEHKLDGSTSPSESGDAGSRDARVIDTRDAESGGPAIVDASVVQDASADGGLPAEVGCALEQLLLSHRDATLSRAGTTDRCLHMSSKPLQLGTCSGEGNRMQLVIDQRTCTFTVRDREQRTSDPKSTAPFQASNTCLRRMGTSLVGADCGASDQAWKVTREAGGTLRIQEAEGSRCLALASDGGTPAYLADCASEDTRLAWNDLLGTASDYTVDGPATAFGTTPYWDTQSTTIDLAHLHSAQGYHRAPDGRFIEQASAHAALEFDLQNTVAAAFVMITTDYSAALDGAGFRVLQDGTPVGEVRYYATGSWSNTRKGPSFAISLEHGQTTRIRMEPLAAIPVQLHAFSATPPLPGKIKVGELNPIAASGTSTVSSQRPSDANRLTVDVDPASGEWFWTGHWSYHYVEYLVSIAKAGRYQLAVDYRSGPQTAISGKRVVIDGHNESAMAVPVPPDSKGQFTLDVQLEGGLHRVRFEHPGYDFGALAGGDVSSGNFSLTTQ